MLKRSRRWIVAALVVGLVPAVLTAAPRPRHFIEESLLPFTALPGATA